MWSVVTESPKMPRARAPDDLGDGARLHREVLEERGLLDVGGLRVERVGFAGRGRDLVPFRVLRGEIGVELAEDLGLQGRLHQVPDLRERRPDVVQEDVLAVLAPAERLLVMSMSTRPASAKATTSGGDMRKFALMLWWTRASKLRLPERTDAATRSFFVIASSIEAAKGPGVADAGRAAVADRLEAELVEVGLEAASASGSRSRRASRARARS